MLLAPLLLAAAFDGEAALRHASLLAALGPHPWGSPRNAAAAPYVANQLRAVGLSEVRLQEFESHGIHGTNVLGVLRVPGPEFVLVGAHHDTAPDAPGAYDDGGGVGVMIEVARVLSQERSRPRTIVFASFDGEEAWSTGKTTTAGSRAYVASLGSEARNLVGAFVIEMCGFKGGTPVLQTIAYADPLRPGASVVAPAWLVRVAQQGAREAGAPLGVGDPIVPWLYQPGVRTFRANLYGDDLSFLQAGMPAVFVSDSSLAAFYPWYHQASDTADKLDADALTRMGRSVLGAVQAIAHTPRGPASDPDWFAAFGSVLGKTPLIVLAIASIVPGLIAARLARGLVFPARVVHAAIFGLLFWLHPVPALWSFLLPNLLPRWSVGSARRIGATVLALLPLLSLLGLGGVAWRRGFIAGSFVRPWEAAVALLALALLLVGRPGPPRPKFRKTRGPSSR
jgi:aminopeptidase YwaD